MSKILVVDDMALCREPIAESLRRHGHEAICASNGVDALALAHEYQPDLILLDVNMPGMDGLETLSALRQQRSLHDTQVLFLTDRSDREGIIEACKRGVQGYLLKSSFSLDDLLERIDKCLVDSRSGAAELGQPAAVHAAASPAASMTASTAAQTQSRGEFQHGHRGTVSTIQPAPPAVVSAKPVPKSSSATGGVLLAEICAHLKLKPLSASVQNVIAASSSESSSVDDVARAAAQDQALSIRLLRVANSSAYRRGQSVTGVKAAVQRIGIQEVRHLVMTLGVLEHYSPSIKSRIDPRLFWEHSLATGLIAGAIAKARRAAVPDTYFLWGIVHDIGRLILLSHSPDRYAEVYDASREFAQSLEACERSLLRLDHCEVLAEALEYWKFSRDFILPVTSHHLGIRKLELLGSEERDAAATIILADRLAHALMQGSSGNEMLQPIDEYVELLRLAPSTIPQIAAHATAETNDMKVAMLSRTEDGPWPRFEAQVRERLSIPVRALCISDCPEADVYRFFFDRLSLHSVGEPPNLGVVFVRESRQQAALVDAFLAAEQRDGGKNVPILFIHDPDKVEIDAARFQSRPFCSVPTAAPISTILEAIEKLLGG